VRDGCGPSCPCQAEPYRESDRSRSIFSAPPGTRYTVEEIEPGLFVYRYFVEVVG
jgi:hypothetical protein